MRVTEYLDQQGVGYEILEHRPTFTAQQMAAEEHVPGMTVAKPVVVKADKKFYMYVLPACCKIDFDVLKEQMGARQLELADEKEMAQIFGDCALGAEPPFGNLYNIETIIDQSLLDDDEVVFQAGTHERAIRIAMADYQRLVRPRILAFSYHTT
ncbi:MAG: YbaK/EbsC family protein [Sedimentisphaerales bacterium]|nr:YbaK/EbsC family protein [Sedimentisphaerales bacterium]